MRSFNAFWRRLGRYATLDATESLVRLNRAFPYLGDEYNVIVYPDLFPKEIHPPAEYPPAKIMDLGRPCTIDDLADWVAEYINSDILVSLRGLGWAPITYRGNTSDKTGM